MNGCSRTTQCQGWGPTLCTSSRRSCLDENFCLQLSTVTRRGVGERGEGCGKRIGPADLRCSSKTAAAALARRGVPGEGPEGSLQKLQHLHQGFRGACVERCPIGSNQPLPGHVCQNGCLWKPVQHEVSACWLQLGKIPAKHAAPKYHWIL